jgi:hypothetical protein
MAEPMGRDLDDLRRQRAERKQEEASREAYNRSITNPETPKEPAPVKKAKGGYVRAADGVAQRGKTKGKLV